MPMSPATLTDKLVAFGVPETDVTSLPAGIGTGAGWPDGEDPPPEPVSGITPASSSGPAAIVLAEAGAPYIGGYVSAQPYWDGAEIVGASGAELQVASGAGHPAGPQAVEVEATADLQDLFLLPGTPDVGAVTNIVRVSDGALIAENTAVAGHDPSVGAIGVHPPNAAEFPAIADGDVLAFTYNLAFAGGVPAGVDYVVIPPKPAGSALYTAGDAWSWAYAAMFGEGGANGIPPTPGAYDAATQAMKATVDGMMGAPGLGALALQAGALAFWGVVAGTAATIWPGATAAIPPATAAGMSAAVLAAGVSALALGPVDPIPWDRTVHGVAAMGLLATAIYATSQGAMVMFQPGPAPVPFPFL